MPSNIRESVSVNWKLVGNFHRYLWNPNEVYSKGCTWPKKYELKNTLVVKKMEK